MRPVVAFAACIATALPITLPPSLARAQCDDYADVIRFAGSVDTGVATAVALAGSTAYVVGGSDLKVVSFATPSTPAVLGTVAVNATDVAVSGDHAVVVTKTGSTWGLGVVDVSQASSPALAGSVTVSGPLRGVAFQGDHAYLVGGAALQPPRMDIVDVSDPGQPAVVGSLVLTEFPHRVAVSGSHAYVASSDGLQVFDVSVPAAPFQVASVGSGVSWEVTVSEGLAYVAGVDLQIVDVSVPALPQVLGSVSVVRDADRVSVSGSRAYVGFSGLGVQVVDIADPASPVALGAVALGTRDVAGLAGCVLVPDSNGLQILDVAGEEGLPLLGYSYLLTPQDIVVSGSHAYVTSETGAGSLAVFDVTDPTSPSIVGMTSGVGDALAVFGSTAYVRDVDRVDVVDVAAPTSPSVVGSAAVPDARNVDAWGSYVYVASGPSGFQVVDASAPAAPAVVGSIPVPGSALDVAVRGGRAYVADDAGAVHVVDVTTPSSPVIVGSVATPEPTATYQAWIVCEGDHVYLVREPPTLDGTTLYVVDATDPSAPAVVSSLPLPLDARTPCVVDGTLYVAGGVWSAGWYAVDVTSPAAPALVTSGIVWAARASCMGVAASRDHVYAFAYWDGGYDGISVFPARCSPTTAAPRTRTTGPRPGLELSAWPVPARGGDLRISFLAPT